MMSVSIPRRWLRAGALALVVAAILTAGLPPNPLAAQQPSPPAQRPSGPPQTPVERATVPAGATVSLGTIRLTNLSPTDAAEVTLSGDRLSITVAGDLLVAVEDRTCAVSQSADAYTCTIAVAANTSVSFDIDGGGRGVQRPLPPPVQTGTNALAAPSPSPAGAGAPPSGVSVPPVSAALPAPAAPPTSTAPAAAAPPAAPAAVPSQASAPVAQPSTTATATQTAPASQAAPAVQLPRTGTGMVADADAGPQTLAGTIMLIGAILGGAIFTSRRRARSDLPSSR